MAKHDFCFTYYDGDAARDKAHMNRLERGAYDDIISAQRKFGHLSKSIIQKILSGDFEKCWESLELVLKVDSAGKFFIEWLENSMQKALKHSENQSENAHKRWDKVKKNGNTKNMPPHKNGIDSAMPLEDGDGNGNEVEIEDENKGDARGKLIYPFDTETFKTAWDGWKKYKLQQHKFKYKGDDSEQIALKKLSELSEGSEDKALLIIQESMSNGWKGFFELKTINNGQPKFGGKLDTAGIIKSADEFLARSGLGRKAG